jgi:hypothetical protein
MNEAEIGQIFPTFSVTRDNVIPDNHSTPESMPPTLQKRAKYLKSIKIYQNTVSNLYPQ